MLATHPTPARGPVVVVAGQLVVQVACPLDDGSAGQLHGCLRRRVRPGEVVLTRLDRCEFVDARGFRALVRLRDEVGRAGGRLVVLDPPRSLRLICRAYPHFLVLVPEETS